MNFFGSPCRSHQVTFFLDHRVEAIQFIQFMSLLSVGFSGIVIWVFMFSVGGCTAYIS